MSDDFALKYRPRSLKTVIGQAAVLKSMAKVIEQRSNHFFLFSGPSGVGKTTLARIAAVTLGCPMSNIHEVDAARFADIKTVRDLAHEMEYVPFKPEESKAIILDECHALSKAAWQTLLKSLEQPPEHGFWFLCTTEIDKLPATIKTRAVHYALQPVSVSEIEGLLQKVMKKEGIELDEEIVTVIAEQAFGSVRQALKYLAQCREAGSLKEAMKLMQRVEGATDDVIKLCKLLLSYKNRSWTKAMAIVKELDASNPESVRIGILNYLGAVVRNTDNEERADRILTMMAHFEEPFRAHERLAPVILAVGRVLFSED